jgi:hypothetical protein
MYIIKYACLHIKTEIRFKMLFESLGFRRHTYMLQYSHAILREIHL